MALADIYQNNLLSSTKIVGMIQNTNPVTCRTAQNVCIKIKVSQKLDTSTLLKSILASVI